MRSGGYFGSATTGVDRSTGASKRSFCTVPSTWAMSGDSAPRSSATPIAAFASQIGVGGDTGSLFATPGESDNPVVPVVAGAV